MMDNTMKPQIRMPLTDKEEVIRLVNHIIGRYKMNIRDPWNTITVFKGKPQLPKQSAFIMVVPSKGCIELNWLISYSDKPPELYEIKNTKIEHEDSYIIVATSSDAPAGMTEEDRQNLENMEFRLDPKE